MIASLTGDVLLVEDNSLILGVHGIGFRVIVPQDTLRSVQPGEHLHLFTEMVVHQPSGEVQLVGFTDREQLVLFRLLTTVTGVGVRTAVNLMSRLSSHRIRAAIANDQPEVLAQVPGVGMKVARRLVVELRDKVATTPELIEPGSEDDLELVQALMNLGYSAVEARAALQSVPREAPFEEKLRQALAYFAR